MQLSVYTRLEPIMLLNLPIMLFSNALIFPLLCFNFFPIMLRNARCLIDTEVLEVPVSSFT